jgi:hypothetical protein
MELNQLVPYLIIGVLVVALLYSTYLHAKSNRTSPQGQIDLLGAVTDALKDFMQSEVIVNLGKAAEKNIPPEIVAMVIDKIKAGEVVAGTDTKFGQLLEAVKQYLELTDTNPNNDPVSTTILKNAVANIVPKTPTG